jgi:Glycosyl transferase family 2
MNATMNNTRPILSIITATYKAGAALGITAQQLMPLLDDRVQWVVVDGASTDNTLDVIRTHLRPADAWVSEPDKGIYDAWNKGIALARGEWICFLGAGDHILDLPAMLAAAQSAPSDSNNAPRLIYGRLQIRNEQGQALYDLGQDWPSIEHAMKQVMVLPQPCVLHHRSLFEQLGAFDTRFRIAGDYEFLLRCLPHTGVKFVPGSPWVAMHLGGVSTTPRHSLLQLKEVRQAQIQNGHRLPGSRWLLAMARVYLRLALFAALPAEQAKRLLDWGRRLLGKPAHWTRS